MEAGNVNEFLEKITWQEEAIRFNGRKYFFNGWEHEGHAKLDIDLWTDEDQLDRNFVHVEGGTMDECIRKMTAMPVWDGKTFWDAEPQMTWVEW